MDWEHLAARATMAPSLFETPLPPPLPPPPLPPPGPRGERDSIEARSSLSSSYMIINAKGSGHGIINNGENHGGQANFFIHFHQLVTVVVVAVVVVVVVVPKGLLFLRVVAVSTGYD